MLMAQITGDDIESLAHDSVICHLMHIGRGKNKNQGSY